MEHKAYWTIPRALAHGLCVALFLMTLISGQLSASETPADTRLFYDKLAAHGEWVRLEPHGWVWVPPALMPGWRPYTVGRWVYTEAGMTWVSALPWGWATFHYGRWLFHATYGWVWTPGTLWAPAWVAWQVGHGWVGWAPLPPQASWDATHGLSAERIDLIDIEPLRYVFVAAPQMLAADLHRHLVAPARSVTLLQQTRNLTAYDMVAGRVHNRSLSPTQVTQLVGHPVPPYQLSDIDVSASNLSTQIKEKEVAIFRPRLVKPEAGRSDPSGEIMMPTIVSQRQAAVPSQPSTARRELEARLSDEYARLLERQQQELKQAPQDGASQENLRLRHERERDAFAVYAERERQVLANRLRRKKGRVQFRLHVDTPESRHSDTDQ